ncbi:MAG: N-acetylmuramoyl-L-alanine amidase [Alphaproteobacteria bacterium]|nr:N-acetylmuramoyl-L-alanine amidase [Alphaproteobacteria bacterium]
MKPGIGDQGSGIRIQASPNYDDREPGASLQSIVLHYTGMDAEDWLRKVCDPETKLSAHYMIGEDGGIVQLVDEAKRAWHAGVSFWRGETDMNSASIGIELANPGHQNGYRPFPGTQIAALKNLLRAIIRRHAMNARLALLAHSDIAPMRKEDPGELFPWRELAQEGLGLWPETKPEDYAPHGEGEVAELMRAIGYACLSDAAADPSAGAALLAFQRHYHPENLTGRPDGETVARLRALKRLQAEAEAVRRGG